MKMLNKIALWFTLVHAVVADDALKFRVTDGTKANSYIGNLPQNANLNSPSNAHLREFMIVTGDELINVSD